MVFQKYPSYRDTQTAWLGEIPQHWTKKPLWALFRRTKRTGYSDERLLSVYRDYGVIPKDSRDDNNNKPSEDLSPYQLVQPGDLVINKMKAWQGSVAVSQHKGIVSPAYFVFESLHNEDPKYLHYLLRSVRYITGYMTVSKGIRVNQWDLDPQYHATMPVLIPPIDEQTGIAKFLDRETAKIDDLVAEQERLIALLKEKRQAVISHAVTKGLKPDVPKKSSGFEWLGDVPEHWSISSIRRVLLGIEQGWSPVAENRQADSSEWGVIKTSAVKLGQFFEDEHKALLPEIIPKASLEICENDVLMLRGNGSVELVGAAALVPPVRPLLMLSDLVYRLRFDQEVILPKFITYTLISLQSRYQIQGLSRGIDIRKIAQDSIKEIIVVFPYKEEQAEIVSYLDQQTHSIDQLIGQSFEAINLLKERRSALISAAVTGKINVRGLVDTEEAA
tara:strand:- start:6390 stop:7727 length:1338 start_codon:yes stop_codon:yes gene_type:complete